MGQMKKLYIIRTRPLGLHDLVFALRTKKTSYSSLEMLEQAGYVVDLKPEWERPLVEILVQTHPVYEKNFEHFLVSPPEHVKPTDIIQALHERSLMIPTLFVVYLEQNIPSRIEKVEDYYQLLSILSNVKGDKSFHQKEDENQEVENNC